MNALIRQSITKTAIKRQAFLVHHASLFKPLLPPSNYYSKLSATVTSDAHARGFMPYHELAQQPSLIQNGEMKQYQLQGLSFLVWLFENGMNGILGDEMGLGKTLQTYGLSGRSDIDCHYLRICGKKAFKDRFWSYVLCQCWRVG